MKGFKLIILIFSTLCFFSINASAQTAKSQVQVEKVTTLEITPLSVKTITQTNQSTQSYAQRRKISTTLRKPICKKWKSKNWNIC